MKALTLTQPWASMVAWGAKRAETRNWQSHYRGPLAIHAASTFPGWARRLCVDPPFRRVLEYYGVDPRDPAYGLPLGSVVAVADLVDVIRIPAAPGAFSAREEAFGDFTPGRYAWMLENVRRLVVPVKVRGALNLWELDESILGELIAVETKEA